jgi:VIT1/CCC1 family predicted Fe2+/Mn2+ transporter
VRLSQPHAQHLQRLQQTAAVVATASRSQRRRTQSQALGAHLRDELGLTEEMAARPWQAAWSSMASFAVGALSPLLTAALMPASIRAVAITVAPCVAMIALGAIGGGLGGASRVRGAVRVGVGGGAALALTYLIGSAFGTAIG